MGTIAFFRQPFPLMRNRWSPVILVSAFVAFFMIIYQPFGLRNVEMCCKMLFLAGYGLVTFLVLLFNLFILPVAVKGLLREEKWTVGKEILWILWIVLTISAGNYFYTSFWIEIPGSGVKSFLLFVFFTFAVSVIPVTLVVGLSYYLLLHRYVETSANMNRIITEQRQQAQRTGRQVTLVSSDGKKRLSANTMEISCLESSGNYVIVHLTGKEERSVILRSTLRAMERQLAACRVMFRCHRAFIVNLLHVVHVRGNSQGYRVRVRGRREEVPVSRNHSRSFREHLSSL